MNENRQLFEEASVPKAVAVMAIPTMISMLVVVIYNMADTFFIGQTGDPLQVAAVSLATPVFMIFMALGNLFGIGGSSAISRALGEKNTSRAKHISAFCCYGALGTGVVMAVVFLVGMDEILSLIGASENTIGYARDYLRYVALGGPFIMFATAFANILRGEGAAKESMIGNLIGTVTNIVLDPIMILVFGWGVIGAAVAKAYAVNQGVPEECIFIEEKSTITETNLYYASQIMESEDLKTALLVIDPLHMKRSMLMAEDLGIKAYTSPTTTTKYVGNKAKAKFLAREVLFYIGYKVKRCTPDKLSGRWR